MYRKNMTDDFSSETKRTTDSRTTFVKQRKKKKNLLTSVLYPVKIFFSLKMKQRYFLFKN